MHYSDGLPMKERPTQKYQEQPRQRGNFKDSLWDVAVELNATTNSESRMKKNLSVLGNPISDDFWSTNSAGWTQQPQS